jgi:hypothetical protein
MKIEDLVVLLGKPRKEIEGMLKSADVIQLDLNEKNKREIKDECKIEVLN